MVWRALLVDDEAPCRKRLRRLLRAHVDRVEVIGEAADGNSAVDKIHALHPNLVFLDIELPGRDGFQVADSFDRDSNEPGGSPRVVIVSAHREHAVRAWDVEAVDYLLKPVEAERLELALDRLERTRGSTLDDILTFLRREESGPSTTGPAPTRFTCRAGSMTHIIRLDEVLFARAWHGGTQIQTTARKYDLDDSLARFERQYGHEFVRIHRNTLVRLDRIRSIKRDRESPPMVVLEGGFELEASRRHAEKLLRRFR